MPANTATATAQALITLFKQDEWREDDSESPVMPVLPRRLRVCLAASGGGHIRQLLDLEKVWERHDYFLSPKIPHSPGA
jgi:hypothetical protein